MRSWLLTLALVLAGCGEEEPTGITPLPPTTEAHRAPIAEAPSPAIVSPHLRRTASSDPGTRDLRRPSGGGGGGGGGDWDPSPLPPPSARQVEAFRRQLEREMASRVDAEEDPCDQFIAVMRATAAAADQPGQRDPELPSRAEVRRRCGDFSEAFQQCMSPGYFQEHLDECNAELARLAERGERRSARRLRQWEALKRGESASGRRGGDDEEPEEGG